MDRAYQVAQQNQANPVALGVHSQVPPIDLYMRIIITMETSNCVKVFHADKRITALHHAAQGLFIAASDDNSNL